MEYIVFFGVFFVFFLFLFIKEAISEKKNRKLFAKKLYEEYGVFREKDYPPERFLRISSYFRKHMKDGQVDDITWNDLDMDSIFKRMNFTQSATGEEYLYYMLRDITKSEDELEHLEEVICFFAKHPDDRVKYQLSMNKLGYTGKYSLYDYIDHLDVLGERNNKKEYLVLAFYPISLIIMFFSFPLGLCLFVGIMIYNLLSYYKIKSDIEPYIISFVYVLRLLGVCDEIIREKWDVCEKELSTISHGAKVLAPMKKGSYWFLAGNHSTTGSNPLELILDYGKMMFHIDLIQFNRILEHLRNHIRELDELITAVGYLECAVSIGAFRLSLEDGYCIPTFGSENCVQIVNGYHPMLTGAVKNSITAGQGVLLTGSNASGKSTFLKMVALNAILAQTIHTCSCESYQAPLYRIFSSMSLRDDLSEGDSYFIVEIKAIKRILDASQTEGRPVLCFVDEVLRGTNTIERIAAAAQILRGLADKGCMVFAATHDMELAQLLKECMNNYHFEEDVRDGDVHFFYKLQEGPTKTRNAIKLLEMLGFREDLVSRANESVRVFEQTGEWSL